MTARSSGIRKQKTVVRASSRTSTDELTRLRLQLAECRCALAEAYEQQGATTEILEIVSSSSTDLQPVFNAILEKVIRLCDAHMGHLGLYDGEMYQHAAQRGANAKYAKFLIERGRFQPLGSLGRMVAERQHVQVADTRDSSEYGDSSPGPVALAELGAGRTFLAVPMLKEGRVVGGISIYRPEVRPFTQKQIELVSTFARQAVIAFENARLFNETKDALERQTATAEILKVISSSPTNPQPVFDAILEKAMRLCDAHMGHLGLYDGDKYQYVAQRGTSAEYARFLSERGAYRPRGPLRRLVSGRQPIHIADMRDSSDYRDRIPRPVAMVELGKARTYLAVPMLKEGRLVGAINIYRPEVRPFTQKQIDLVSTFADQAVIAIENVRLFREIQDKSRQLEIADQHKSEFLANMSHELRTPLNSVIGFSDLLLERMYGELNAKQESYLRNIQASGKHLLSLINDILDLSKIAAGHMELDVAQVHVASALQNAMMLIRERAQRNGIPLSCNVDSRIADVPADERKFKQIMLNLLSNAVKFTPQGGRVDMAARPASPNCTAARSGWKACRAEARPLRLRCHLLQGLEARSGNRDTMKPELNKQRLSDNGAAAHKLFPGSQTSVPSP